MLWLLLALFAHVGNAFVFIIDKGLLGTNSVVSRPAWYAGLSGVMAAGAGLLLLIHFVLPTSFVLIWSLMAGGCWVVGLWLFYIGLKEGEASRIVPIAGSSVPLFTLLFSIAVGGEHLSLNDAMAIFLLIAGGLLLSLPFKVKTRLPLVAVVAAVASGVVFAAYFTIIDFVYSNFTPFVTALAYTRLGVGVVALLWLGVLMLVDRPREQRRSKSTPSSSITGALVASKTIGMGALVLQHYAISLGSVAVVNALQGFQYLFLLVMAVLFSKFVPRVFKEELNRIALGQKVGGIVLVSAGLILLLAA